MNETDITLLTVYGIAFLIGYLKGILKTILGPISLFLGTIVSYALYSTNQNIILALVVGLFGPFIIRIVLSLLCKALIKTFQSEEKIEISSISRILGGLFSITWSGGLFTIFVLLITLIPFKFNAINKIHSNIKNSQIITFLKNTIKVNDKGPIQALTNISEILRDPEKIEQAQQTKSYKTVLKDPSIKDLLKDEETLKQLEEKDIAGLIKNEKIQALLKDPDALNKLFDFQKELISGSSNLPIQPTDAAKNKPEPKFMLFKK